MSSLIVVYGIVILPILIIIVLIILTHLRPLTFEEVMILGSKRRTKELKEYFSFKNYEVNVDMTFKKRMNPNGKFYQFNEVLYEFPSIAAGLLKYKKHEWSIIAFERETKIFLIWLNKGSDNSSVSTLISSEK